MRIYWYLPVSHTQPHTVPRSVIRRGDRLVVHALERDDGTAASEDFGDYEVFWELPRVSGHAEGTWKWKLSRAATYVRRTRMRARRIDDDYDVLHIQHLNHLTDWSALPRLGRRAALVSTVLDVLPHDQRLPTALQNRVLRRLYAVCGKIIVAHDALGRSLTADFGVTPERIKVIPLPAREELLEIADRPRPDPPVVLFFGQFRRNKGIPVLLEAIRKLAGVDATFYFAGRGSPELEKAVRSAADRDDRIRCEIGYMGSSRRIDLYAIAALVVLPYTEFGSQSGVLLDAYSSGIPAIVTDVGALGDSIREEGAGWVVPPSDPDRLAEALREAVTDEDARAEARQAARRASRSRMPVAIGRAIRDVYDEVVSQT